MTEPKPLHSSKLDDSWTDNAERWTKIVRSGGISSRRLATDDAILDAVLARSPADVLDLGCGEGWLARELAKRGIRVVGTDASAPLVEAAKASGEGEFHVLDFAAIAQRPDRFARRFDVVVANFSLLGEDLSPLLDALPAALRHDGALIIQTLHPATAEPPYLDGWRLETFAAFDDGGGWTPMPWYFRTLASWHALLSHRWIIDALAEPLHPGTGKPLSLLITLRPKVG